MLAVFPLDHGQEQAEGGLGGGGEPLHQDHIVYALVAEDIIRYSLPDDIVALQVLLYVTRGGGPPFPPRRVHDSRATAYRPTAAERTMSTDRKVAVGNTYCDCKQKHKEDRCCSCHYLIVVTCFQKFLPVGSSWFVT